MSNETLEQTIDAAVPDVQDVTGTPIVDEPTVIVPVAPVVVEEKRYEYQPTDEQGRSLGGKQVIKYHTQDELIQKITDQNVLLVRKLREETKKQRLGIAENEHIPETAQRFNALVDFKPRSLSSDERVALSRDLLDPEKFSEASSTLFEATVGAKPEAISKTLTDLQYGNIQLTAIVESEAFMRSTPEYFKCKDNADTLTNWMAKNNLYPSRDNFSLAYNTLKAAGLLLDAPSVREEVPVQPPQHATVTPAPTPEVTTEHTPAEAQPVQDEPSRITAESPAQSKRPVARVASGLNRTTAGDAGTANKPSTYTLAQIDAMSSEVYRRKLLHEKGFAETCERLVSEAAEARKKR